MARKKKKDSCVTCGSEATHWPVSDFLPSGEAYCCYCFECWGHDDEEEFA